MTECTRCGMPANKVSSKGACLTCCAQDIVEEELRRTGRDDEIIDVDEIIGTKRRTCPSCDSNDKAMRFTASDGIGTCRDIWHDLRI